MYRKRKGRKNLRPSEAQFNFQYYELEMDPEEMAKIYGVRKSTIYNWASQFRKEAETKTP